MWDYTTVVTIYSSKNALNMILVSEKKKTHDKNWTEIYHFISIIILVQSKVPRRIFFFYQVTVYVQTHFSLRNKHDTSKLVIIWKVADKNYLVASKWTG